MKSYRLNVYIIVLCRIELNELIMNQDRYILSLCIPTWNRAKFLKVSLDSLLAQYEDENVKSYIELIISDNASSDETKDVVDCYVNKGLPIRYSCNIENIGADKNFIKCMQLATGKYILLLGDDDILMPGTLAFLIDLLKEREVGLVHFQKQDNASSDYEVFSDTDYYIKCISYYYTYMSGNIFRKDIVSQINEEKYIGSYLLQMPYFIKSTLMGKENVMVYRDIIKTGLDAGSNGGYNYYQVFVQNYLSIWREFYKKQEISADLYKYLKKDTYENFVQRYNVSLLSYGKGIRKKNHNVEGKRGGFMIDDVWRILFSNYGKEPYFYRSLASLAYWSLRSKVGKILRH